MGSCDLGYHPAPYHPAPYHPEPYHPAPYHPEPYHQPEYKEEPKPYNFEYGMHISHKYRNIVMLNNLIQQFLQQLLVTSCILLHMQFLVYLLLNN